MTDDPASDRRRHRRRLLQGLAAAAAVAAFPLAGRPARAAAIEQTLTFLHFNDCYQISPRRGVGGFAPLATLLKRERARAPGAITTFGGDLISPSLLAGLTKGAHMIELMNAVKTDVAVLGNHEFDHGAEVMIARIRESAFPWLAANALGADGAPFGGTAAIWTRKVGEITVGIVGLITPQARIYIRGGIGATFAPFLDIARDAVQRLRQQGAQIIVALTHMNLSEDQMLAREVRGIHLILGGHEHIPITVYERGTLILKAGTDAEFLGVIDLDVTVDGGDAAVVPSWRLVANHRIPADHDVQQIVRHYENTLTREFGQAIGKTETLLDSRAATVRLREAAIGNLIADAMREATGADIAMMNGGGIRGNKLYPPNATLTRRDVLTELPFNNIVVVVEATGADIRRIVEYGLRRAGEENGGFPHVSGLTVVYDAARPAGSRIVSIAVAGTPLEDAKTYRLATNDFIAAGGDGYTMLRGLRRTVDENGGPGITNVVIDYVTRRGTIAPKVDDRLKAQ